MSDFNLRASTDVPLVGLVISHVYLRICRDYPSRVKDWRSVPMTVEERLALMEGMAEKDGAKLTEAYMDAVDSLVKEGKREDSPYARSGAGSSTSSNRSYSGTQPAKPTTPSTPPSYGSLSDTYARHNRGYQSSSAKSGSAEEESPYAELIRQNPRLANAKIYSPDGTYLGKLSTNKYDSESISNPYGKYGSKYGNTVNNPYGTYGSKYSSKSWHNPYAREAPYLVGADGSVLGTIKFEDH